MEREIPCFDETVREWKDGMITAAKAAERCGLSRQGFYYRVKKKTEDPGKAMYTLSDSRLYKIFNG